MSIESLEGAASFWAVTSLVLTGILAIAGALAWYFADQAGAAKDARLKTEISSADARGAEANEKAAKANERAATLEKEAATARLKLEELRRQVGPRQLDRQAFLNAIQGQPKARVEIAYLRDDPECFDFAQQIWRVLQAAAWDVSAPAPIPVASTTDPTAMAVGGQPSGVTVVSNAATEAELRGKIVTPWTALQAALLQALGKISASAGGSSPPPVDALRVVVAPR